MHPAPFAVALLSAWIGVVQPSATPDPRAQPAADADGPDGENAMKALTMVEQSFVGRWTIDLDKYLQQVARDPARFGLPPDKNLSRYQEMVLLMMPQTVAPIYVLHADHTAMVIPHGVKTTWRLENGAAKIVGSGKVNDRILQPVKGGMELVSILDVKAPATKVLAGKTLTPAQLNGEWVIDADASTEATRAVRRHIAAALTKLDPKRADLITESSLQGVVHTKFGVTLDLSSEGKSTVWFTQPRNVPVTTSIDGDTVVIVPQPPKPDAKPDPAHRDLPSFTLTAVGDRLRTSMYDAVFILKRKSEADKPDASAEPKTPPADARPPTPATGK
jgi:hypothetical protein